MFEAMDNAYFKERAADIKDVSYRLLCNVLGLNIPDLTAIDEEVIIVAEEMTPSDTAQLNKKYALGFVTEIGGKTSHAAIMAVALGLPAVVGCTGIMEACKHGDTIILDAKEGDVILYNRLVGKILNSPASIQQNFPCLRGGGCFLRLAEGGDEIKFLCVPRGGNHGFHCFANSCRVFFFFLS